jgi:hypothetical protein
MAEWLKELAKEVVEIDLHEVLRREREYAQWETRLVCKWCGFSIVGGPTQHACTGPPSDAVLRESSLVDLFCNEPEVPPTPPTPETVFEQDEREEPEEPLPVCKRCGITDNGGLSSTGHCAPCSVSIVKEGNAFHDCSACETNVPGLLHWCDRDAVARKKATRALLQLRKRVRVRVTPRRAPDDDDVQNQ